LFFKRPLGATTILSSLIIGFVVGCGDKDDDDTNSTDTSSTDTNSTDTNTNTDTSTYDGDSNRTSLAAIEALGEPEDSECRGYVSPTEADLQGCTMAGPYMGEIVGDYLGGEGSFEAALDTCLNDSMCSGMSTNEYMGAPWIAYSATEAFVIDESSPGCTFLFYCP